MALGIEGYKTLPEFKRQFDALDDRTKNLVVQALRDLKLENPPQGLRLEKLKRYDHIWAVRVSGGYRLTFHLDGNAAVLRRVGPHDETYDNP